MPHPKPRFRGAVRKAGKGRFRAWVSRRGGNNCGLRIADDGLGERRVTQNLENRSLAPKAVHLYVVGTPIGNLADFTDRARAILAGVDLIACEDTRTTGGLLNRLSLRKELVAYHEHNETEAAEKLVEQLAAG